MQRDHQREGVVREWMGSRLAGVILVALVQGCGAPAPPDPATLSPEAWREDLRALARTLEDASPGFIEAAGPGFPDSVEALRTAVPDLPYHLVLTGFARLAAMADDGHTELWLLQGGTGFRRLPISIRWFADGPRIAAASPDHQALVGGVVRELGGLPVDSVLARVARFISADNRREHLYSGPAYLRTPEVLHAAGVIQSPDGGNITVETAGSSRQTVRLQAMDPDSVAFHTWGRARQTGDTDLPLWERRRQDLYWFEHLEESNTLYLQINRSRDAGDGESLAAFTRRFLREADDLRPHRLVVDLRHNVGGNFELTEELAAGIGQRPRLSERGRLYVATARQTFSAGIMLAVQLLRAGDPILVGEPGRGNPNGSYDADVLVLPRSRLELEYTSELHEPLPETTHLDHLPVDVEVPLTFDDWARGRDPVLAWILRQPIPREP